MPFPVPDRFDARPEREPNDWVAVGLHPRLLRRTEAFPGIHRAHRVHGHLALDRPGRWSDIDSVNQSGPSSLQAGRHECHQTPVSPAGTVAGLRSGGITMMEAGPFTTHPARRFRLGLGGAVLVSLALHALLLGWLMFGGAADLLLVPLRPAAATLAGARERPSSSLQFTF